MEALLENKNQNFSYINFLIHLNETKADHDFPDLDLSEMQLLESIVLIKQQPIPCTVSNVISAVGSSSASASHRRLKKLKHIGLVNLVVDEKDNRLKYVVFTPLAATFFDKMGRLMNEAQRGGAKFA